MDNAWVYMLQCSDGSFYVGKYQGDDLQTRVDEHNAAKYPTAYTARRRPVTLVWSDWFSRYDDAAAFERRLKGWSRVKKQALIRNDQRTLKAAAKRGFRPAKDLHPEERRSRVTKGGPGAQARCGGDHRRGTE
ncbi:MAG: GIY-YIG nuclease family protein [Pseudomonadota bacterium]